MTPALPNAFPEKGKLLLSQVVSIFGLMMKVVPISHGIVTVLGAAAENHMHLFMSIYC